MEKRYGGAELAILGNTVDVCKEERGEHRGTQRLRGRSDGEGAPLETDQLGACEDVGPMGSRGASVG